MAMKIDSDAIPNHLLEQREAAPDELQHYFIQFEDYWERKLWHELTNLLIEYFSLPESAPQRISLYNGFIKSFASKINKLKLVTLGLSAAEQFKDHGERLVFVKALADKVNTPASQDAYVFATVEVASIQLSLDNQKDSRKNLDECEKILEGFDSVETVVHAAFYKANAAYYKSVADFAAYYKNALLYLACVSLEDLTPADRASRAYDLSIAALISESIYNFGELLLHPILDSLAGGPQAWLRDMLFAFNRGDLAAYGALQRNAERDALLRTHETFLVQKLSLAALTETVFRRPPHDRALSFDAIGRAANVERADAEHLVMKALSLGLLRGSIDQVAEIARINWVQPKVLDMKQIESMRLRLREWDGNVNRLGTWIEGVGKDVWAA